jgi:hypothetical protein
MGTTWYSRLGVPALLAVLALALVVASPARAQISCGDPSAPAPLCDGACPPGLSCVDTGGLCGCVPTGGDPCGVVAGPPLCWGECPPGESCIDAVGVCTCMMIPTLSEWGIIGMSLVMFGGVVYLRRRHAAG